MAYKLIEAAQTRWRTANAPELVALVRNRALFHQGKLLERPRDINPGVINGPRRHHRIGSRLKLTEPQVLTIPPNSAMN